MLLDNEATLESELAELKEKNNYDDIYSECDEIMTDNCNDNGNNYDSYSVCKISHALKNIINFNLKTVYRDLLFAI